MERLIGRIRGDVDDADDAANSINDIEESVTNIEDTLSEQDTSLDGIVDGLREERDAENNLRNIAIEIALEKREETEGRKKGD